jgi:hypothetical protein
VVFTLQLLINFAPVASAYSLQEHFCALKPQTRKWNILTAKITKVETKPRNQPQNANAVELVHNLRGILWTCFPKIRRAQLYVPAERNGSKTHDVCGFAGFARLTPKRGCA